jgi:branched-chain amino acid aminotransferase
VQSITWNNQTFTIGQEGVAGPMMTRLYEEYTGIQTGDKPDNFGWLREIR